MASLEFVSLILLSGFLFLNSLKFGCYCQAEVHVACSEIERDALLKFKQGIIDPSGQLSSWVGEDCCSWRGVNCDNSTEHVVALNLRNPYPNLFDPNGTLHELGGTIDSSLLLLSNLTYLDLSMNNFGGIQIPTFLGALTKLKYLNLSGAAFGGRIPPALGNLSRLQFLDLSNQYKGPIESDLSWLSDLYSLKYLNLGGVNLSEAGSDWLRVVNMLPSLAELHLDRCGLSELPLSFPDVNLTSLLVLDLSKNDFSSPIPQWLFNVSNLRHLTLTTTNLQGELPDAFTNLKSLEHLDLSENTFIRGQLSRNLGKLCNLRMLKVSITNISGEVTDFIDGLSECSNNSLESLDLGYNQLNGSLPVSLGNLKNLRFLSLWHNSFQGSIPSSVGNLLNLEVLSLSDNQMQGSFPESLGQLSRLVALDLSDNSWEGTVTEVYFANLSSLQEIELYKDSPNITLVFNFSFGWVPPFKLTYIRVRSCQLGPKFPLWLRNQTEITTLILNNAALSDIVPQWFWQLGLDVDELDFSYNQLSGRIPNSTSFRSTTVVDLSSNRFEGPLPLWTTAMEKVYLRDNMFSGPIPDDIGKVMPFLSDLDISFNSLNGTIPMSIGNLKVLTTLVISNNKLSREIPQFWNNIPFLYILDMSNNSLSGTLPDSIGSLVNLKFLILSNNNLSGELPLSMKNCTLLDSLDLGENKFSGNLPNWIGESMKMLLILRLRSNFFSGNIPSTMCSLSNLHILDFSHNNLSGIIPPCVGNLTGLKTELTDKDTERYEGRLRIVAKGRVLEYYSTLYLVNSLDLSDNYLSGEIPSELTKLVELGTLNLSMNHLTGSIPLQTGNLGWLETLDLSKNQLSGSIPPTMAQLTFLNHLNLSYNNLSGEIPTSNQFQTLNDPSIYGGNAALCGMPLPKECSGEDDDNTPSSDVDNEDENDLENVWFFLTIALGFFVGFWGVCGTLIIKKSWRVAYFDFIDEKKDTILAILSRSAANVQEKFMAIARTQREV